MCRREAAEWMNMMQYLKNKKGLFNILLSLFCSYSFQVILSPRSEIAWLILFIAVLLFFSEISIHHYPRPVIIASTILGLIYSTLIIIDYALNTNDGIDIYFKVIACYLGIFCFLSAALAEIINYFLSKQRGGDTFSPTNIRFKRVLLIGCVLLLFWLPYYISCFPGAFSSDTVGELRQHFGTGKISNHHPIMHQLLLRFAVKAGLVLGGYNTGAAIYSSLQMIAGALIFAYCIEYLRSKGVSRKGLGGIFVFYALFTIIIFYSFTLDKDTVFSYTMVIMIILLIKEINGDFITGKFRKVISLSAIILVCFLFCTLRNNGYYAFVLGFLAVFLLNIRKDGKRLAVIGLSTILLVSCYNYVLFDIIGVSKSSTAEKAAIPIQTITRVVKYDEPDLDSEEFRTLSEIFPDYDLLVENYLKSNIDSRKTLPIFDADTFDQNPSRYLKCWLKLGVKHPVTYLEAVLFHIQEYFSFNEHPSVTSTIYPNEFGIEQNPRYASMRSLLTDFHRTISETVPFSVLYSPGIVLFLFILCFALLFLRKKVKEYSPFCIPGFLYLTAFAAPVSSYRYILGIVMILPLFLGLSVNSSCTPEKNDVSAEYLSCLE